MNDAPPKLANIGPKSAAWLRQVGLRTREDIAAIGPVAAFAKIKRAGFKPSLNLLYALEGALTGQHWQHVAPARREQLLAELELAIAQLPATRGRAASAVTLAGERDLDDAAAAIDDQREHEAEIAHEIEPARND